MARFRENVCIVVQKAGHDLLLLCHRKGFPPDLGWQFPQGGLHKGEDFYSEMRRELREEIGTDAVTVVRVASKRYAYKFPRGIKRRHGTFDGQIQQWVLVEFSDSDDVINFNHEPAEFDAFEWATAATVLDRIVDFKKKVYTEAMRDMGLYGPFGNK
jgi:putative (di)nucleoside polyphosphate hydrolase